MSGNEPRGRPEADHWARYDALPPRFKRLLQLAHTNYQVGWVADLLSRLGCEPAYDQVRRMLWRDRRADILSHYGPTHPEVAR